MTRKPEFITFTGADDRTSIEVMRRLSDQYPIEWGILFSPKRQGVDPRYPGGDAQSRLWHSELRLSAHLCGEYSRRIMDGKSIVDLIPVDLWYCERVQVNHADPKPMKVVEVEKGWGPKCIAQCRGSAFPAYNDLVQWLFDRSGGRGTPPDRWPPHPGGERLVGYAGGITPANVRDVIEAINSPGPYWIDMESGVRTPENWFDLELCRQVCAAVYADKQS